MTDATVTRIQSELTSVEQSEDVVVLLAVESGSRAWGFPPVDSDFDVRFIYLHPPRFWESCPYRYAILDRDAKFGTEVVELLKASGIKPKRTSPSSPWQNGVAERWIGSCRRELMDDIIALNESHLRRLIRDYISYYHADRTHHSLEKTLRRFAPFLTSRIIPLAYPQLRVSAVCITAMIGNGLRNNYVVCRGSIIPQEIIASPLMQDM